MSDAARTLWLWYVASGDAHGRYWAIAPAGSVTPEVVADEVTVRVASKTVRVGDISRGFIEAEGRLLIVRTIGNRIEATIIEPDDRPTLAPPPPSVRPPLSLVDPEAPV